MQNGVLIMSDELLEPRSAYYKLYKDKYHQSVIDYFNDLVKKSGINIEENRSTVNGYYNEINNCNKLKKNKGKNTALKSFLTFMIIVSFIAATIFIVVGINNLSFLVYSILIALALISGSIGFIILIVKVVDKRIKGLSKEIVEKEKEIQILLDTAWKQMNSLNVLFDWNIPAKIINSNQDLIKMDENLDGDKYVYLVEKYGLHDNSDPNKSCLLCQSGSILGNPFLLCKELKQDWYTHTYEGSITIHWTTTVHTKDGTTTVHHTQVLTAHVYKPAPYYSTQTYLVYGNDAAPDLIFSRAPSGVSGCDEKKINKIVKNKAKELDKRARKELMDDNINTNYTRFGDDEFEVLFGGINRNHEVQFNLLFTPLARKNLLDIIKNKEPFGDDFYFSKEKKLNFIKTNHSQTFDYDANPRRFMGFDFDEIQKEFISYNDDYFKNFFFELAPILSIPIYQQQKPREYIYKTTFKPNMSLYEDEVIANKFNIDLLQPEGAKTHSILKAKYESKLGKTDKVKIIAYSFDTIEHVDVVSVYGGDGRYHNVPVSWKEYIPIEKHSHMVIQKKNSTRLDYLKIFDKDIFKNCVSNISNSGENRFERNIFSILVDDKNITEENLKELNKVFGENKSDSSTLASNIDKIEEILKNNEI